MPFRSESQRRFMHARHPEMANRWEEHTPKGKKLPEKVKHAFNLGTAAALERFGMKSAAEEIRLKIPRREFHGWDEAFRSAKNREGKRAHLANETADGLAELLTKVDAPDSPLVQTSAKDPLDRSVAWGSPSNLAAGDTANRLSDMGQPTSIGMV